MHYRNLLEFYPTNIPIIYVPTHFYILYDVVKENRIKEGGEGYYTFR